MIEKDVNREYVLSIFYSIWFKPREVYRNFKDKEQTLTLRLAILWGISLALFKSISSQQELSIGSFFTLNLIIGSIYGVIGLDVTSGLLSLAGKLLKGKGYFEDIKKAVALSKIPIIWGVMIFLIQLIVFGKDVYYVANKIDIRDQISFAIVEKGLTSNNLLLSTFAILCSVIYIALFIWSYIILLKCLSEAQGFSIWKAALGWVIISHNLFANNTYLWGL